MPSGTAIVQHGMHSGTHLPLHFTTPRLEPTALNLPHHPPRTPLAPSSHSTSPHPASQVQVHTLSPDFTSATRVVDAPTPALPTPPGTLLLRHVYAGVNASDVNYSAGR